MKIAFIVEKFPALSETFIISQITGLIDLGHDVRVFARTCSDESHVHRDFAKYALKDRVKYTMKLPVNKNLRRLKTLIFTSLNFFKDPILVTRALKILLSRKEGFSYEYMCYLFAFIRQDFDVVHCHFGPSGLIGAFLKQAGLKAKLVTTFHGYDATTYIRKAGPDVYKELFRQGDLFTYNSEATKQKVLGLNCPPERMAKLPMGVEFNRFPFKLRKAQPDGQINVLSVGRLVEMKGREYAIKAMAMVIEKFDYVNYNIVGDGVLRQSLQALIDDLNVADKIKLLGWVSSEQLNCLYDRSHLFLHPSVTSSDGNMEGQGVVLVEAQACGLPVVATNHSAFPETVSEGNSAFLVPEKDVDMLAERLNYLVEHPAVWESMGQAGRDFVEQKYDIEVLSKKLVGLYESLNQ